MSNKEPMKLEFAPGCFDTFDGTQEELDELIAEIEKMVASGEFLENSEPIDFETLPEEVIEQLIKVSEAMEIEDLEEERKSKLN